MLALKMRRLGTTLLWIAVAALGAAGFAVLALSRGESISAAWILCAGVASYVIAYRFYARFLALKVFALDDHRATPAERLNNDRDFVPTNKWVLFGHHFSAIAGARSDSKEDEHDLEDQIMAIKKAQNFGKCWEEKTCLKTNQFFF